MPQIEENSDGIYVKRQTDTEQKFLQMIYKEQEDRQTGDLENQNQIDVNIQSIVKNANDIGGIKLNLGAMQQQIDDNTSNNNAMASAITGIQQTVAQANNTVQQEVQAVTQTANSAVTEANQTSQSLAGHTGDTANPHKVTAEQAGAYTKDEANSTFVAKTLTGAFYGSSEQSFSGGFVILPCAGYITECNNNLYETNGAERPCDITFKVGGLYKVELSIQRSDLPAGQNWQIGFAINDQQSTLVTEQMTTGQYGWSSTAGPNRTWVPLHLSHMVRVEAGDYINFNNNSQDGPRSYNIKFSVTRVSD